MQELIAAVLVYPGVPANWREPDLETPPALMLPFELEFGGDKIGRMLSTVTTLSTPQDVTLAGTAYRSVFSGRRGNREDGVIQMIARTSQPGSKCTATPRHSR